MNVQCSGGSRSFAKETRALKMRIIVAGHWKLITTTWERSSKLILLQLHKLSKNRASAILSSFGIWSKLEKYKSSVSASWAECKSKKLSFWSVVFSYSMQQQWTISWSDCDVWRKMDFMWQSAITNSVVGLRSSKALPKAKLVPERIS